MLSITISSFSSRKRHFFLLLCLQSKEAILYSYHPVGLFKKTFLYEKRVLGRSKIKETIVICSRKIKKLYNINLSKKGYIDLLPLVNLHDFCLEKTLTCYFELHGHFS